MTTRLHGDIEYARKDGSNRTLYRLSSIGDALPASWCYLDLDDPNAPAATSPGAQCWSRATKILTASTGHEDGMYGTEQGYDRVLVIEARGVVDGGDWDAVTEADVVRVWSLPVDGLVDEAIAMLDPEGDNIEDDIDLEDWLVERDLDGEIDVVDKRVHALMMGRASEVEVVWVDTL